MTMALALLAAALACQPGSVPPLAGAHRGLSAGAPENTLSAFHRAADLGVAIIELDLRTTSDGALVVMHDKTVDRTTDGTGAVAAMSLAELRALDAGSKAGAAYKGERIPEYGEVLDFARQRGVTLLLDIKDSGTDLVKVVTTARQHGATDRIVLGLRSLPALTRAEAIAPEVPKLGFVPRRQDIASFLAGGADIIRLWSNWLAGDRKLVKGVHAQGRKVWALVGGSGPHSAEGFRKTHAALACQGVDAIITDAPELLP